MPTEDQPYRLGDGYRELEARAQERIEALKAASPVKITAAEREADKAEIARLRDKTDMLERVAHKHADHIRSLRAQVQALTSAVAALQQRARPVRAAASSRRDPLNDALEAEIHS
jgi:hypothetical protein